MITFQDGPAQGQVLELGRAPVLLRVVLNPAGKWDALDQLGDTPEPGEQITVYLRGQRPTPIHINATRRAGGCRWVASTFYRLYDVQPPDDVARDNSRWRAWCEAQRPRLRGEAAA